MSQRIIVSLLPPPSALTQDEHLRCLSGGYDISPLMDGIRQFYNKIIFCSMVDRIRKSPRTAVGALSILPHPPPRFLHVESDDISSRGGVAFPIMP